MLFGQKITALYHKLRVTKRGAALSSTESKVKNRVDYKIQSGANKKKEKKIKSFRLKVVFLGGFLGFFFLSYSTLLALFTLWVLGKQKKQKSVFRILNHPRRKRNITQSDWANSFSISLIRPFSDWRLPGRLWRWLGGVFCRLKCFKGGAAARPLRPDWSPRTAPRPAWGGGAPSLWSGSAACPAGCSRCAPRAGSAPGPWWTGWRCAGSPCRGWGSGRCRSGTLQFEREFLKRKMLQLGFITGCGSAFVLSCHTVKSTIRFGKGERIKKNFGDAENISEG